MFGTKQMNDKYWEKFYKDKDLMEPSLFACFCQSKIKNNSHVLEIGAGEGRDTRLFGQYCTIAAIEPNIKQIANVPGTVRHFHGSFEKFILENKEKFDIIYSRWFIHAVEEEVEDKLLWFAKKQGAILMLEFRVIGDESDDTHERRLIDPVKLFEKLINRGFIIKHFEIGHGLSKQGDDDPFLARVIAGYDTN